MDDVKSVKSGNLSPRNTLKAVNVVNDKREVYIRLVTKPKTKKEQDHVMDNFKNIIRAISKSNPKSEVEIFNNNGRTCRAIDWKNGEEFKRHFKIYHSKPSMNRNASYWTTVKLSTSTSVKSIRNHETVKNLLKQTYTRLRYSEWSDSEEDSQISTIGFLLKYDPKNCPSKQAETEINSLISEVHGFAENKIPRWKTMMTSTTNKTGRVEM